MQGTVPTDRVSLLNDAEPAAQRSFVLYWMVASRRVTYNFGLQRAVDWAVELGKPLVVLETLCSGRRWAADRHHAFVMQGMAANARALSTAAVSYYPFVEHEPGSVPDLVGELANNASVVVTDQFPCSFVPQLVTETARRCHGRVEQVDGNGLLPLRAADQAYPTAYAFRRHLQRTLPAHLAVFPRPAPLSGVDLPRLSTLPEEVIARWPAVDLTAERGDLSTLPIDHAVPPCAARGGTREARVLWDRFDLRRYADARNVPDQDASSGLSPHLHHGHISVHELMADLFEREGWSPDRLGWRAQGKKQGWWGLSEAAEGFVDQLVTWRELGYGFCFHRDDHDRYDSLPEWARTTLEIHASDARESVYSLEQFERAQTHDPLWNAAQRQLLGEGRIHNYLRMLWGKKILEWTPHPREALEVMVELNNKYALDGQDPNSYSGIFWVLGRHDRPWGPQRAIFGKVRYMTSANTARKVSVRAYLDRYSA